MSVPVNVGLANAGMEWKIEKDAHYSPGSGLEVKPSSIGITRLFWDNILIGSSTFCLLCCKTVMTYPLTDRCFPAGTELWVVSVPDEILKAVAQHVTNPAKWLCLPVHRTDPFPNWNWNPITLDTPKEARRYLTGWNT